MLQASTSTSHVTMYTCTEGHCFTDTHGHSFTIYTHTEEHNTHRGRGKQRVGYTVLQA